MGGSITWVPGKAIAELIYHGWTQINTDSDEANSGSCLERMGLFLIRVLLSHPCLSVSIRGKKYPAVPFPELTVARRALLCEHFLPMTHWMRTIFISWLTLHLISSAFAQIDPTKRELI